MSEKVGGMFRKVGGKHVTREIVCRCGKTFVQYQISKAFVDIMPENARRIFQYSAPDGFVPLNCPPCERKALAAQPLSRGSGA